MAFRLFNRRSRTPEVNSRSDSSPTPDSSLRRETLEERSKRVIGTSLDDDFDGKPVPPRAGKKGATKRREQILQAQRAHRQRTQLYMKKLEREVLKLREADTKARSRARHLEQNVDILKRALRANGLAIPQLVDTFEPQYDSKEQVRNYHDVSQPNHAYDQSTAMLSPALTNTQTTPEPLMPRNGHQPQSTGIVPATYPFMFSPPSKQQSSPFSPVTAEPPQENIQTDNLTGVDFVLALESPCLEHMRSSHLEKGYNPRDPHRHDENFSNHVFTTSMHLLHGTPANTAANPHACLVGKSEVDIESLLEASYALDVHEGSVPPVQMWDTVRRVALEKGVSKDTLRAMVKDLMPHVHCDGFGAVVDTEIAQAVANRYLA